MYETPQTVTQIQDQKHLLSINIFGLLNAIFCKAGSSMCASSHSSVESVFQNKCSDNSSCSSGGK